MPVWKSFKRALFGKKKPKNDSPNSSKEEPAESIVDTTPDWDTLMKIPINELDTALLLNPMWLAVLSEKDQKRWEKFEPRVAIVQRWRKLVRMTNEQFYEQVVIGDWGLPGHLFDGVMTSKELNSEDRMQLTDKVANSILDLPSEEFLRAMRTDGLDDKWTEIMYANENDAFIERVIHKNNEAGKNHNLQETQRCMVDFLEEHPHLARHPDGLLYWARQCERRAEGLEELRNDDDALRKYLVVNEEHQKFLELWRMSQIKVLRDAKANPTEVFRSESCRGVRGLAAHKKRLPKMERLPTISSERGSITSDLLFPDVDPKDIKRRHTLSAIAQKSPVTRSRKGSVPLGPMLSQLRSIEAKRTRL